MKQILIIARSARALTESAKLAGYKVHSMDCFADEDTTIASTSVRKLGYRCDGFIDQELFSAVQSLVSNNPEMVAVAGTGFEAQPEQIKQLKTFVPVLSNNTKTIRELKHPDSLGKLLSKNSIKYPRTYLSQPKTSKNFLVKKIAGSGGDHVQWLMQSCSRKNIFADQTHEAQADQYFQEYITGKVLSAVFLANGKQAKVIGFNHQLQTSQFDDMPFLYQGAIGFSQSDLKQINGQQQDEIDRITTAITVDTNLKGLCGIDFILTDDGDIYVLEVNPRPPATFELHEQEQSLFDAHLSCFKAQSIKYEHVPADRSKAYAILYTSHDIEITSTINWPDWVKDRPTAGVIPAKFPVCSVHVEAASLDKARELLQECLSQTEVEVNKIQNAA